MIRLRGKAGGKFEVEGRSRVLLEISSHLSDGSLPPLLPSWTSADIEDLREKSPELFAGVHPAAARRYPIANGGFGVVGEDRRKITVKPRGTEDILEGVVTFLTGGLDMPIRILITGVHCREPILGYPRIQCQIRLVGKARRWVEGDPEDAFCRVI